MNKKKQAIAGLLLDTFGTILLLTVITVCIINFVKDSRGYQMLAEKASVNITDTAESDSEAVRDKKDPSEKEADGNNIGKKDKETVSKSADKPSGPQKEKTEDVKKPVQPGEEP